MMKTHIQNDPLTHKAYLVLSHDDQRKIKKSISFGFIDRGVHAFVIPDTTAASGRTLVDLLKEDALTKEFSNKGYFTFIPTDDFALQLSFIDGVLEGPAETGGWVQIYNSQFRSHYTILIYPSLCN